MDKEKLFISMGLIEVKEKIYTKDEIPSNLVYTFKNENEFNNYFLRNGLDKDKIGITSSALITILNDGTIVAFKVLCDYIITSVRVLEKLNKKNKVKILTLKES